MNTPIRRPGFSLVEIMIVVAVIGMLAAIAIPQVVNQMHKARIHQAEADLTLIASGVNCLTSDTGMYPSVEGEPIHYISEPGSTINAEVEDLSTPNAGLLSCPITTNRFGPKWQGPYLQEMPPDPWGRPYFFDPDYNIYSNRSQKTGLISVSSVVGSYGSNRRGKNEYDSDDIFVILKR